MSTSTSRGPGPRQGLAARVAEGAGVLAAVLQEVSGVFGAVVQRRAAYFVGALTALVVALAVLLAIHRPLWNDELFTYYIGGLPNFGDVWSELESGYDPSPPLFYLLTRGSFDLFGMGVLSVRLPALIGLAVMGVCLYQFVARRSAAIYGLIALVFPAFTAATFYAVEAKPYGLLLGFSAVALLCWQRATEGGPRRTAATVGLGLSLAGAISCHYYAVLLLVPLGLGELARTRLERRFDWAIWASFAGGLLPLLIFLPLIRGAKGLSGAFWAHPDWTTTVTFYPDFLLTAGAARLLVAVVVGSAALVLLLRSQGSARRWVRALPLPAHESVAVAGLLLLPLVGVTVGKLGTGGFTERYAVPAVLGLAIVVALSARLLDRGPPLAGIVVLFVCIAGSLLHFAHEYRGFTTVADERADTFRYLDRQSERGLPIVLSNPHQFLELSYYSAQHDGPSFLYLADPSKARERVDTDTVDLGLLGLRDVAPELARVESYRSYLASRRRLLIFGGGQWDWLIPQLLSAPGSWALKLIDRRGDGSLYEATSLAAQPQRGG